MPLKHRKSELISYPRFRNHGLTLLEIVIAILILSFVSVGCLGYQYFAARMAVRANAELTITRTARMVLDNWKKEGGDEYFEPTSLDIGFVKIHTGTRIQYKITANQIPMVIELDWENVDEDTVASVILRQIEVIVRWRYDYQDDEIRDTDPSYIMTTYVRIDEAGG